MKNHWKDSSCYNTEFQFHIQQPSQGQYAHFFRLPVELRSQIYQYVYPEHAEPERSLCSNPYILNHCISNGTGEKLLKAPTLPKALSELGFLLSCRQVWHESALVALLSLKLHIIDFKSCRNWIKHLQRVPDLGPTRIAVIQPLEFRNVDCTCHRDFWCSSRHGDIWRPSSDFLQMNALPVWATHLAFKAAELELDGEIEEGGPDDDWGEGKGGVQNVWSMIESLRGVRLVSLWTTEGYEEMKSLLRLQHFWTLKCQRLEQVNWKHWCSKYPDHEKFRVELVDEQSISFSIRFYDSDTARMVAIRMVGRTQK